MELLKFITFTQYLLIISFVIMDIITKKFYTQREKEFKKLQVTIIRNYKEDLFFKTKRDLLLNLIPFYFVITIFKTIKNHFKE